jgi:hypothetical protein
VDEVNLGEERPFPEFVHDDVQHFGARGVEQIPEKIVRHGTGRLNLFEFERNRLSLECPDDNR